MSAFEWTMLAMHCVTFLAMVVALIYALVGMRRDDRAARLRKAQR
jgi:ABC-type sulfate transport system permease component